MTQSREEKALTKLIKNLFEKRDSYTCSHAEDACNKCFPEIIAGEIIRSQTSAKPEDRPGPVDKFMRMSDTCQSPGCGNCQIARYIFTLEAIKPCQECERLFPMLDGPAIPWALAETLYQGYVACNGSGQSLERLAERGGFGWKEISIYWKNETFKAAIGGKDGGQ